VLYQVRKIPLLKRSKTLADIYWSEALKRILVPFHEDLPLEAADAISDAGSADLPGVTLV
jgi:hypothetical protein